jgi:predicted acylesterase/phospholipase RssA
VLKANLADACDAPVAGKKREIMTNPSDINPDVARSECQLGETSSSMLPVDPKKDHYAERRPPFECTALLLQGGGALGAYQAGVYQALSEAGIHPGWVAGISIGAINSAIIAGNPPERRVEKLREFWERVTSEVFGSWMQDFLTPLVKGDWVRGLMNQMSANSAMLRGASGFFVPRVPSSLASSDRIDRSDQLLRCVRPEKYAGKPCRF